MKTRIDHATVVTPAGAGVSVLADTSIAFENGAITAVGPTAELRTQRAPVQNLPPLSELRGRPLGSILLKMGRVTAEQITAALDRQRTSHGVIGHTLVEMGAVTEADVEAALAAQAGRDPSAFCDEMGVQVIDGRDALVIPGLVNTHHHLYQSLTRCMPAVQDATLFEWLTALYPKWRELSYDALKRSAMVSIAELLLSGCTTTSDHHYLFPLDSTVAIEAVLEAAETLGIRIHACRGSMSLGQSAGGLPPDTCIQDEETILADCRRALERFHDPSPLAMRRIDLAPCSPFSVTPRLLRETQNLAREFGALCHTHAAETLDEERYCLERFGVRPIEYLRQNDWLAANVYLAHCVHLNDAEIALLAETQTGVSHCPSSNMRLASGIAPVRRMLDASVKVGVGVDGSSSNDGANMLGEARQALLLQRVSGNPKAMSAVQALRLATVGSASVLDRSALGRIAVGAAADLVMFDINDVAFAGAFAQDPLGAVMIAQPPRPRRVFVAGKPVVEAGRIGGVDWPRFIADFNQLVRERFR